MQEKPKQLHTSPTDTLAPESQVVTVIEVMADFERLRHQSAVSTPPNLPNFPNPPTQDILALLRLWLKQKKLSAKSKTNYLSDARQFLKWLGTAPTKAQDFIDYTLYLQTQKTPDSTFNRKLASLRHLSRCLSEHFAIEPAWDYLKNIPQDPFENLLLNFKRHLKTAGYKGKTIVNYLSDLKHYLSWARNNTGGK